MLYIIYIMDGFFYLFLMLYDIKILYKFRDIMIFLFIFFIYIKY